MGLTGGINKQADVRYSRLVNMEEVQLLALGHNGLQLPAIVHVSRLYISLLTLLLLLPGADIVITAFFIHRIRRPCRRTASKRSVRVGKTILLHFQPVSRLSSGPASHKRTHRAVSVHNHVSEL
jgi:hypothetical protein